MNTLKLYFCNLSKLSIVFFITLFSNSAYSQTPVEGAYLLERWKDTGFGYDVKQLVQHSKFYDTPEIMTYYSGSRLLNLNAYEGVRMRGYITAPESGLYTFWVSAKPGGQVWLSPDSSKYRKELICYMGADSGSTTIGVQQSDPNLWDHYATQISEEIELVAGQVYYFEALGKAGHGNPKHLSLAWKSPSGEREEIPLSVISSYENEAEDSDDDFLPDTWESLHGLNVGDNGLLDRDREGERGDFDSDGLSNRLEYLLGTDPANPDSDGDGIRDGIEVNSLGTDPNQPDIPDNNLVRTLDLSDIHHSSSLTWTETSSGFIPSSFRGETTWNFHVPEDGYWVLNILTTLLGDLYLTETINFDIEVDGKTLRRESITYGNDDRASIRYLTSFLTEGHHTLTLNIDNLIARRTVSIQEIQLLEPTGADVNQDGVVDWVISEIAEENYLLPYLPVSRTSPAFFEGYSTAPLDVTVNNVVSENGVDFSHWYTDLPLNPYSITHFTADISPEISESGSIQWLATNVFDEESLTIRKGDQLKLLVDDGTNTDGYSLSVPMVNWTQSTGVLATQSTTIHGWVAERAIDGSTDGEGRESISHTDHDNPESWWKVDLGQDRSISSIVIHSREGYYLRRTSNYRILVTSSNGDIVYSEVYYPTSGHSPLQEIISFDEPIMGREVLIEKLGLGRGGKYSLTFAEVEVLGGGGEFEGLSSNESKVFEFGKAGTFSIEAESANGQSATLTVEVKQADFVDVPQDLLINNLADFVVVDKEADADLIFDGGDLLTIAPNELIDDGYKIFAHDTGSLNLVARLPETGAILGKKRYNVYGVSGASQNDFVQSYLDRDFIGYRIITSPIVVTNIPEGGYVVINIDRSYVSFIDEHISTRSRVLRAEDFENGVYLIEFLFPIGQPGGFCHSLRIYDRNGVYIGTR